MTTGACFVDLDGAKPSEAVVVVDVLRAFTTVPWMFHQGAERILAVADVDHAHALRRGHLPDALLAGEVGGQPLDDFDLGNSPSEVSGIGLAGATIVHRTSAGTQGLARTVGSGLVLAASFVTAAATARALHAWPASQVTFVVTGASLGRDGDEDLACAELIAARLAGHDPDPAPYLSRAVASDAGRMFTDDGPTWAPAADLVLACELDRFEHVVEARADADLGAVELHRHTCDIPSRRRTTTRNGRRLPP